MPEPPTGIDDVIAAAGKAGHAHCKAIIADISDTLAAHAAIRKIDILAYRYVIDTAAVRHIRAKHGNVNTETSRGQIAETDKDLPAIPDVLSARDFVVFGHRNKHGQMVIGYIKRWPDGTDLYLEEMRVGRTELAAASIHRYLATINAHTIAGTLNLNGRADGGNAADIVDMAANVTGIRGSW